VADGRLHLSGVVMLAKHLTEGNVDELVALAARKSKNEIAELIARRFSRPDLPERLQALSPLAPVLSPVPVQGFELAPGQVDLTLSAAAPAAYPFPQAPAGTTGVSAGWAGPPAAGSRGQLAPGQVESPRARMTPLAPERFGLQITLDRECYDLLEQARALMSHQNPGGEIASVLKSALRLLVARLVHTTSVAEHRPWNRHSRLIPAAGHSR